MAAPEPFTGLKLELNLDAILQVEPRRQTQFGRVGGGVDRDPARPVGRIRDARRDIPPPDQRMASRIAADLRVNRGFQRDGPVDRVDVAHPSQSRRFEDVARSGERGRVVDHLDPVADVDLQPVVPGLGPEGQDVSGHGVQGERNRSVFARPFEAGAFAGATAVVDIDAVELVLGAAVTRA